jgi:hypothetical protein
MGAPYIYDIIRLRVNEQAGVFFPYCLLLTILTIQKREEEFEHLYSQTVKLWKLLVLNSSGL